MLTRYQKKLLKENNNIPEGNNNNNNDPPIQDNIDEDDIDEHGNIKDLIDYNFDNIKPKKNKISKKSKKSNKFQQNCSVNALLPKHISTVNYRANRFN